MSKHIFHNGAALAVAVAIWAPSAATAGDVPDCNGVPATIVGTEGPDQILGTAEDDVIVALGGDDSITGDLADDVVCAGEGDDTVMSLAGLGAYGGPGDDRLEAHTTTFDSARLEGDEGDDEIVWSGGQGQLNGGAGDDILVGGEYGDWIDPGPGRDTIDGGDGEDSLEPGCCGAVHINLTRGVGRGQGRDSITGIEDLQGTPYDDVLIGNDSNNGINGGSGGLDVVRGRGGDDWVSQAGGAVFGGSGDDVLYQYSTEGGPTDDNLDGGAGFDSIRYDPYGFPGLGPIELNLVNETSVGEKIGHDVVRRFEGAIGSTDGDILIGDEKNNRLDGGNGPDRIWGGGGDDHLDGEWDYWFDSGGNERDQIWGGEGDDHIRGGFDNDKLFGDQGDDYLNGGEENDTLDGGEGVDRCRQGETLTGCE